MKKFTFLIYHQSYDTFLLQLRDLGLIHVVNQGKGALDSPVLQEKMRHQSRFSTAIKQLKPLAKNSDETDSSAQKGDEALLFFEQIQQEKALHTQQLQSFKREYDQWKNWGNFDPEQILSLQEKGYRVHFYICSERDYSPLWIEEFNAIEIYREQSKVFFVTVTKSDQSLSIAEEPLKLPEHSLQKIDYFIKREEDALEKIDLQIKELAASSLASLALGQKKIKAEIDLAQVRLNTRCQVDDKLMMIQGWAPADKASLISDFLADKDLYFEMSDPTEEDDIPVELRNKGFFKLFEPICELYMLPKYNEIDLTPYFAPFFMLFFGLCLGDSGYGLLMFLAAFVYKITAKKIKPAFKALLLLVQILAVSTFFCGFLTGTFFGFNLYEIDLPFFQQMKELLYKDNNWMFQFSLILGGIQIIFGMFIKAANKAIQFGFVYALSTIGWILLLLSTVFAAVFADILPMGGMIHLILLGISAVLIFCLNSPGKNIFLNIGLGFWDTYNMATGLLGDILSYVRLFALGLSGGILASVFNALATGMSPSIPVLGTLVTVLIFLIGHSINLFMNALGAMVHPMRLTFVEFFKNADYQGGGKAYQPFKNE